MDLGEAFDVDSQSHPLVETRYCFSSDKQCDARQIGADGHARRFVEPESIDTTDILDLPLAPACQALAVSEYQSHSGEAMILDEPLYWPNQNRLLSAERKVIVSPNHGTIRPENLDPRPFLFHRSTRLEGLYTSLRSFRWSYYQTLVDQLPMLYVLGQMAAELDQPIQLVYLPPLRPFEEHFVLPRLPSGVELLPVEPSMTYVLSKYVFASFLSNLHSGFLPSTYLDGFLRDFCPSRPRRRDRLIYITRKKASKGRRINNESELESAIGPLGFEAFVLEDLSVAQQIELFYDARCVVGPHGAGLANLFFCADADVFELFGQPWVWPHFYFICKARQLRYHFQCGTAQGRHDNFSVDVPRLVGKLEQIL